MKSGAIAMCLALLLSCADAEAQSTFRISQLYTDLDGGIQYVVLSETAGDDGQDHFAGLTLTSTYNGVTRQFKFSRDLPSASTAYARIVVRTATADADEVLPARFLGTAGGTIDFAGIDTFTYDGIPADGVNALNRDGTYSATGRLASRFVQAVEYVNASRDRHYLTAKGAQIDALDRGVEPGWQRSGEVFWVASTMNAGDLEWRFIGAPLCAASLATLDSGAADVAPAGCSGASPGYAPLADERDVAFYAAQPDAVTGECPLMLGFVDGDIPTRPVYRLARISSAPDIRHVGDLGTRNELVAAGWSPQGYGPLGVAWCSR